MQKKSPKKLYPVRIEFTGGPSRTVKVRATSPEQAETRALKFHPTAIGAKCNE